MKRNVSVIVAAMAMVLCLSSCLNDLEPQGTPDGSNQEGVVDGDIDHVEGELFVRFSPEVEAMLGNISRSGASRSGIPSVDEVLDIVDGYHIERVFPIDKNNEERSRQSGMHLWYIVRFKGESATEVAKKFSRLGEVQNVSLNNIVKRNYNTKPVAITSEQLRQVAKSNDGAVFNDPMLPYQWDLINDGTLLVKGDNVKSLKDADVQVENAWKKTKGSEDIIVAVLDEAVWPFHPDLKANMWVNEDEVYGDNKDNDGNGYSGDYHGYDFVSVSGALNWSKHGNSGHGTHVAGVIGAVNNNGIGMSSIAGGDNGVGGVRIMSCAVFSGTDSSTDLETARAIKYAADNGAVIIQCSWGFTVPFKNDEEWIKISPLGKEAIDYFVQYAGSRSGPIDGGITIWAAGNDGRLGVSHPGAYSKAVSVTALAPDLTPATYTNYGGGLLIAAPGGDRLYCWDYDEEYIASAGEYDENRHLPIESEILSTMPLEFSESGYGYMQGTSMACPHVSGVVALAASHIAQQRRIVKGSDLQRLMFETATPIEGLWPKNKMYYGYKYNSNGQPIAYKPESMNLSNYSKQVGSLVNATKLLEALDGYGEPMKFPNIYIGVGQKTALVPARYFVGGEQMSYEVNVANAEIATYQKSENKFIFEGINEGTTSATITTSGGTTQEFLITVRKGASHMGWM